MTAAGSVLLRSVRHACGTWAARPTLARMARSRASLHRAATAARAEEATDDLLNSPREFMDYDVVIVGAGPAGLAAGIQLRKRAAESGQELSVCVVEKGAEVGAHILSGNVFEPRALDALIPDWKERDAPIGTPVTEDQFLVLPNETSSFAIPNALLPKQLHNEGNYVISLSKVVRWLGEYAEELGVEIFPGFSASEVLYGNDGAVKGIATRDMGINKDGTPKATFARGMELRARQTLFAEGCRGSCSEEVMKQFNLREGVQPQTYGLGVKEVWEIPEENFRPGFVQHTLGWPLQQGLFDKTFGGSFLYHMEPNLVLVGFVVGLDYENPYLSPYEEFQRWKTHPAVRKHLEGGECIAYGARCLNEGGYHAIPKLTFPGGALLGCSAGFLNSVKIKGSHTAMESGRLAGNAVFDALTSTGTAPVAETGEISAEEASVEVREYQASMEKSWVFDELKEVRNCHQAFHYGVGPGLVHSGLSTFITRGKEPWTLPNDKTDAERTRPAAEFKPIEYPKPDGKLTFDLLSNLARSNTYHEDQPSHLRVKPELSDVPADVSYPVYAAPESRFCPARVYEYSDGSDSADGKPQLIINAQNCVHCKCCSIKTPREYINWTVPEGSGGPNYEVM
ncbi:dehydrogenase [Salpingoeca rosetta]|uniref:Electron transfer flavoprotein-ubiquinone oxidoreductase n=1 Tax=Salpingoeca rosetta (strain ATCC 50818 / BSB-021) TaxID=946362 RepID=F2U0V1_SALR5|nr:dehydrogenase [Salpingoeca rosetta]EGD80525.1 dehydrogenase [Salpingoeca rosetta]|eukprot:XP_004997086.1 dehydrogenase [Salpingoeca rosetta]